jgi:Tol biopolymer transport system component
MLTTHSAKRAPNILRTAIKAALMIGLVLPFTATAEETSRISVSSKNRQSNGTSWHPMVSADNRYVVFQSDASNLVPNDTNDTIDIFVHDRETKKTKRVNVASDGTQAEASWNNQGAISANGRYVGFVSDAPNLVPDDNNSGSDVFVHDLKTKKTTRVNVASDGSEAVVGDWRAHPSLSADGRYVAFMSPSGNLVAGDTNNESDVFVHDRKTKKTTRVSVASDGTQGNGLCFKLRLSANGRYVAFQSESTNLVKGDTNNQADVFVHDMVTKQTTRVSVASDGSQANNGAWQPAISADGRYVVFWSSASNLVPGDKNFADDVFLHDRETHKTTMVSVASDGTKGNGMSSRPTISDDGRYVGFTSAASNLAANDDNGVDDVFVHDRVTGTTKLVSVTLDGTSGTGPFTQININGNRDAIISPDGQHMAFRSLVTDLVTKDTNGLIDVFFRDLTTK